MESREAPRSLPADVLIAERTLLGTLIQSPEAVPAALKECRPGLLYDDARRHLYEAAIALHVRREPIATGPLIGELRARSRWSDHTSAELAAALEHSCEPVNLRHYCRTIRSEWATRQRINLANELGDAYASDAVAAAETLDRLAAINAEERGPGSPKWSPSVLNGPAFDAIKMPDLPSLLGDGLLCAGELAVIFGPTGKGKSFLGEQLVHAIATGEQWFGFNTVEGGLPVLVVHLELSGARLQHRRLSRWDATPRNLHTTTSDLLGCQVDILRDEDRSALVEVAQNIGARLIYVDPLHEMHSAGETNEAFHRVVRALSDVMIRTGAAVLVAHHEPKSLTENGASRSDMDSLRGGTRLAGAVKLAMRLKELKAPRHFDLAFAKVTHREAPQPLYLRQNAEGWFEPAERPAERANKVADYIERMLIGAGPGANTPTSALSSALGRANMPSSHDSVRRALDEVSVRWGFTNRQDIAIGSNKSAGWTFRQGSQDAGVAEQVLLPQESEWLQ